MVSWSSAVAPDDGLRGGRRRGQRGAARHADLGPQRVLAHVRSTRDTRARATMLQGAVGDPRRRQRADLHAAEGEVQPRVRRVVEHVPCSQIQRSACSAPQLWPTIPGQPSSSSAVVARRAIVPSHVRGGRGLSSFVRGSGARYSQLAREVAQRRRVPVPAQVVARRAGAAVYAVRPERAVGDAQPGRRLGIGQRQLVRDRRGRVAVEQRHPDRAERRLPGVAVHRMPQPDGARAARVDRADVEGLVALRQRGEARGYRRPCRRPSHSHSG